MHFISILCLLCSTRLLMGASEAAEGLWHMSQCWVAEMWEMKRTENRCTETYQCDGLERSHLNYISTHYRFAFSRLVTVAWRILMAAALCGYSSSSQASVMNELSEWGQWEEMSLWGLWGVEAGVYCVINLFRMSPHFGSVVLGGCQLRCWRT